MADKCEDVLEQQNNGRRSSRVAGKANKANESMSSESNLVIDEYEELPNPIKKKAVGIRLTEEPVNITCTWQKCSENFTNYPNYIHHAEDHALSVEANDKGEYPCAYQGCTHQATHLFYLAKHVAFHVYHDRLKNIGDNVVERRKLPKCTQNTTFEIPTVDYDYECEWGDCKYISGTLHEFIGHIQGHVSDNPKHCKKDQFVYCKWKICKSKFSSQYKLLDHVRSHTKEKTLACRTCGTMFATKTKFIDHRKRQIPMELHTYQCSECFKLFATERLLRDHIRSHINHYKCNMCDMTCQKPSELARHIRIRHLDERHFKCTLCEQACVSKYNLEQHLVTHCAEKLMACEECDFKCRSVYGLDRHYQIVHGQGTPPSYECHCCKKIFYRGCYLSRHLIQKHGFSWPSGHSRFRYKVGVDGIFRLNTVRYESLEVTQEMLKCTPPIDKNIKYELSKSSSNKEGMPSFVLKLTQDNVEGDKEDEHLNEDNVDDPTDEVDKPSEGDMDEDDSEEQEENNELKPQCGEIIITINDIDDKGNIIKSEVVNSSKIVDFN